MVRWDVRLEIVEHHWECLCLQQSVEHVLAPFLLVCQVVHQSIVALATSSSQSHLTSPYSVGELIVKPSVDLLQRACWV